MKLVFRAICFLLLLPMPLYSMELSEHQKNRHRFVSYNKCSQYLEEAMQNNEHEKMVYAYLWSRGRRRHHDHYLEKIKSIEDFFILLGMCTFSAGAIFALPILPVRRHLAERTIAYYNLMKRAEDALITKLPSTKFAKILLFDLPHKECKRFFPHSWDSHLSYIKNIMEN